VRFDGLCWLAGYYAIILAGLARLVWVAFRLSGRGLLIWVESVWLFPRLRGLFGHVWALLGLSGRVGLVWLLF
jgi:hypothetical protein